VVAFSTVNAFVKNVYTKEQSLMLNSTRQKYGGILLGEDIQPADVISFPAVRAR